MGARLNQLTIVSILVLILIIPAFSSVSARSVHSVEVIDLFPRGDFSDDNNWQTDSGVTFLTEDATYTDSMIADNRMSLVHDRPDNYQTISIWADQTPTNSNYSIGAPDSQITYTSGPVIELAGFDTSSSSSYELISVSVVVAFRIPDILEQDQVQFIMNYDGNFENLVTYLNTQSPVDYMTGNSWTKNVTGITQWNWQMIEDLQFKLDYVSIGGTDDTRLEVDALGIEVVVKYPWYGSEWSSASSIYSGHSVPLESVNLSTGQYDNMALSQCGLSPSLANISGVWISEILQAPPSQSIGRVHYNLDDSGIDDVTMQYSISSDGIMFDDFINASNHQLVNETYLKIRISSTNSCISSLNIDYNDPSLNLLGRVFGNLDGLSTNSKWKALSMVKK